jgi:hypothetical protein
MKMQLVVRMSCPLVHAVATWVAPPASVYAAWKVTDCGRTEAFGSM